MKLRKIIGILFILFFTNLAWSQTAENKSVQEKKKSPSTEQKKEKKVPSANNKKVKTVPLANNKKENDDEAEKQYAKEKTQNSREKEASRQKEMIKINLN